MTLVLPSKIRAVKASLGGAVTKAFETLEITGKYSRDSIASVAHSAFWNPTDRSRRTPCECIRNDEAVIGI